MALLAELKRRNVIRMAGLYLVGAWLLVQVAGTVLPIFHTPDWALQALVALVAIGFVPMLVFAWVFELTPEGIRRDADVALLSLRALQAHSPIASIPAACRTSFPRGGTAPSS